MDSEFSLHYQVGRAIFHAVSNNLSSYLGEMPFVFNLPPKRSRVLENPPHQLFVNF